MKKLLLLPFVSLLLLLGCKKDDDPTRNAKLPEATQEGRNTVGFTLEGGEVWVPYFECGLSMDPCGKVNVLVSPLTDAQKRIALGFAKFTESSKSSLTIMNRNSINSVNSTGEKIDSLAIAYTNYGSPLIEYGYPQPGSSFLITRFDRQKEIISGTFHLILKESGGDRTVTLSNGRFDYKFGTCECD